MACHVASIPMTLRVTFNIIRLLQAFSNVISRTTVHAAADKILSGSVSRRPSALAELMPMCQMG